MTRQRRHYSPEHKVALLREHLVDKVPVSDIWEKNGIAVNLFYLWQKTFFENGQAAFTATDKRRQRDTDAKDRKIADLEAKLLRKHEVLSERMEEHVQLNKARGELEQDAGFPTTPATKSSTSSTAGPTRPASPSPASCCGSAWPPPSGTPGSSTTARSTSTTPGSLATTGSRPTRARPFSTSRPSSPWRATAG